MKKINKILIFMGIILSLSYTLIAVKNGDFYNILIRLSFIPVLFIPKIIRKLKVNISDVSEMIFILFVFLAQFLGSIVKLYNTIYWFDTFVHFLSGIVVSFFALEFIIKSSNKTNLIFNCLFILGISSLIAVSWEIFEFTSDNIFHKDAQKVLTTGVNDTMKDMIVALLGSMLFCISYVYEVINNKKIVIGRYIEKIKK